ncbi:hypothetical protein K0M31_008350 [Melipona bicolor]|uniref:Uncharacterized protein n=1 Tax=Melipona bicolor TaxID=60889 RepID=A0AA40KKG0_9HYME|nr:hypothetical protein K0M31_008350 [Melipona bicolor]
MHSLGNANFRAETVGIEVRVTNEVPTSTTEENAIKDTAPPWTTMSVLNSRTTPPTPTNHQPQYLSPHVFQGRNSLCCTNDYTLRRRRPMTLRIGPRLSLPNKSTSAPTTTTDGEWPALGYFLKVADIEYHLDPNFLQIRDVSSEDLTSTVSDRSFLKQRASNLNWLDPV